MKFFAYYLPQFHEIPENNQWWGNGFTEWTNVKKAQKLYHSHMQPKCPLNNDYYNLLDRKTIEAQTLTAQNYGIDGFIYYHYYFKGKKLLEKPAENFLEWKDINHKYFFCWANHSWIRAWQGSQDVLQEQDYGKENDWREHFEYLLPFFQDDRYEKIDGKPVFMLFKCDLPEKLEMLQCFDQWCKENGFNGIFLIESSTSLDSFDRFKVECCPQTSFIAIREPDTSKKRYLNQLEKNLCSRLKEKIWAYLRSKGANWAVRKYSGNKLFDELIQMPYDKETMIGTLFFEWDNTPRHGRNGYIITPPDKKKCFEYMDCMSQSEYIFINSWNEWAEGTMIEPTKELGFQYLEWIKEWRKL